MKQVDLKILTKTLALFLKQRGRKGVFLLKDLKDRPRFIVRVEPYVSSRSAESLFADYRGRLAIDGDLTESDISVWEEE